MKNLYQKKKYELQTFFAVIFLILTDLFILSSLSTTKEVIKELGEGYIVFGFLIYLVIITLGFFFLFKNKKKALKRLLIVVCAFMTVSLIDNVSALVLTLPKQKEGFLILLNAFLIWVANLAIFTVWYWFLDRGGPEKRHGSDNPDRKYDLVFPQEANDIKGWRNWKPGFLDYMFLSFFSSMAFTPTDTLVLSGKMKFLLMVQATISLVVLAMIAARAINIIN